MRWPWQKPVPEAEKDDGGLDEARAARKRSERDLHKVRGQREDIERTVDNIREIRSRNHLAEIFEQSLRNRRKGESGG